MNVNPQTQSLLFSVPQEIRDRIYKLVLGGKDIHIFENFFQIQGHVPEYARGLPNLHQDRLTGHWWIEAGFGYSICRCTEDTDSDRHAQTAALFKADLQSDNEYVGRSLTSRHIAHSCRLSFGDEDYAPRTLTTGRPLPPVYIDFALLSTCRQIYIEMKTGNSMPTYLFSHNNFIINGVKGLNAFLSRTTLNTPIMNAIQDMTIYINGPTYGQMKVPSMPPNLKSLAIFVKLNEFNVRDMLRYLPGEAPLHNFFHSRSYFRRFFKGLKDLQGQAANVHVAIHYEPSIAEKENWRPSKKTRAMLYELGMKMENEIKGIE